jgi:hypothetical protein
MTGLRLRHLIFTGPGIKKSELYFEDGLNIVFGASNTGKSYASLAILFMLGAVKALPETDEVVAYDAVWLGIELSNGRNVTLYRPTRGGHFKLYEGLVNVVTQSESKTLRSQHESSRTDTVSHFLLEAMGLAGKQIVRDGNGKKDTLSIRLFSPYAVVSEEDIIAKRSPVLSSGSPTERTFERNLFKLILTGLDDASVVTVPKPTERKVAKAAKLELIDEWIEQLKNELGEDAPTAAELENKLARLDESAAGLLDKLQGAQSDLDDLVGKRRTALDKRLELKIRAGELGITLDRFAKLQSVYKSDLERLQSIEEGGFVLVAMAGMACPVCGAPPEAQQHNHATAEIDMAHRAAAAESRKIELEQRELSQTVISLAAEAEGLQRHVKQLKTDIEGFDQDIEIARVQEVSLRGSYEKFASAQDEAQRISDLHDRLAKLNARREKIAAESTKREGDGLFVGPDATTAFKFGETVKSVLRAWKFPDAEKVQFDATANDITIGGKARAANGKGVRAILHAAFNVSAIVYCIDNNLPHPGFLVLDTPLLTYREPMNFPKHGELSEDEIALKSTSLAEHFYRHLASLREHVQFVVIENSDPPEQVRSLAKIEIFTGLVGNGRFGLLERSDVVK